jgi:hypothetical protein
MVPGLGFGIAVEGKVCIVDSERTHAFKIPFARSFDATNNKKFILAIPERQMALFADKANGYIHSREGDTDSIYLWFIITKCAPIK